MTTKVYGRLGCKRKKSDIYWNERKEKKMEMSRMWPYDILNSLCLSFMFKEEQRSLTVY